MSRLRDNLNPLCQTQPRGNAVLIAMILVLLLAGMSVILSNQMLERSMRTRIAEEDLLAFEAAEAGLDAAINDINQSPTVPLVQDQSSPPYFTVNMSGNPYNKPLPAAPNGTWKQVYSNTKGLLLGPSTDSGQHPIYVHPWFYDGDPNHRGQWIRPGCLGTQYWMPASKKNAAPRVPQLTPNVDVTNTQSLFDSNFCPNDNLIPSGPLGADYISRPMWKLLPVPTFAVPGRSGSAWPENVAWSSTVDGPQMAHENYITPLSLGDTAFFTYAIDWLHDGRDNNPSSPTPAGAQTLDDASERNKFTVYSTGIHLGLRRAGVSENGTVVTVEATLSANDYDSPIASTGPLEIFP
jgi:hypothetical protein